MPRPPFDPNRARGDQFAGGLFDPTPVRRASDSGASEPPPARPDAPPGKQPANELTVGQFSQMIVRTLEDGLRGQFRIKGEIANISVRNHIYFTLKDAEAVLSCVMWSSDAARLGFRPKEGDAVVATGKIGHYPQQGRTQLYVTRLEPQGTGDLQARFDALVKELRGLGYFEESRKKAMPVMPRRVAVVTSAGGAALQDVLQTARERCPAVEFVVVDVRVQGEGAAGEVARALRALDRRRAELGIDAVIVTRGGGSREDLWAFNERIGTDAAFHRHLPLVAAICHEVDTSII
ncbi:MAG: exodeoxyribonuclease VII large subunit, partial [Planctomycetota bacterium]